MTTTGMILTNAGNVPVVDGSVVPTDLTMGPVTAQGMGSVNGATLVGGSVGAGCVAVDNSTVGLVDVVPTTSSVLMTALNGPLMVPASGVAQGLQNEVKVANPVGQQQQPPASIPQEIATMSEHDLISYINPHCFDQGEWTIRSPSGRSFNWFIFFPFSEFQNI